MTKWWQIWKPGPIIQYVTVAVPCCPFMDSREAIRRLDAMVIVRIEDGWRIRKRQKCGFPYFHSFWAYEWRCYMEREVKL